MQEIERKIDLILESQLSMQKEVLRLNSKIDKLDEKFEKKLDATNQRIDDLDEKVDKNLEDIANMFRGIFEKIPA